MWVFAPFGVLMPGEIPAKHVPAGSDRTLQVRVRCAHHLDILREKYMGDDLGPTIETPGMDYNFRAYCTKEAFAVACYKMALDIDYVKFKEQTEKKYSDKKLHDVYVSIWGTLTRLNRPYAGAGNKVVKHGNGTTSQSYSWDTSASDAAYEARDIFDQMDAGDMTTDEGYGLLAAMPEAAWKRWARPEEVGTLKRLARNLKRRNKRAEGKVPVQSEKAPF